MLSVTLLIGTFFSFLSAAVYLYVGYRLSRRRILSPDSRLAWQLFTTWWFALGVSTLFSGAQSLIGALGVTDLPLFWAASQLNLLAICVALFGLLYYLIYLFTGSKAWLAPMMVFYVVYYGLLIYFTIVREPQGVNVGKWSATIEYAKPAGGPLFVIVLLLLVVPQILGSLAYFTLAFRVDDRTQKYRISLVSWSIVIWFGISLVGLFAGLSQFDWWVWFSRFLGLAATLTILAAYVPPGWIKRRFMIRAVHEEPA